MDVSLDWLRRHLDLPEGPDVLSPLLTGIGLEVEAVAEKGAGVEGVLVGEVTACAKHPEADKLSVCRVETGAGEVPVVCGAPNVAVGQKVLFAPVGAVLPGGFKIKKAKLRGQESHGMICAEDELGLGDSHDGILVLPPDTRVGTPLRDIPGLCDTVFTLNVTPNRPDCLSHRGVARELAAKLGRPLRSDQPALAEAGSPAAASVAVEARGESACSRYVGRVVRGVKVESSPDWLVRSLAALGQGSINNVVDVTNYFLLDGGQPVHAFDLARIAGGKVVLRRAAEGERLTTLDGVERELTIRDSVIADADKPLVLAGVMGGADSGVTDATTDLFLEVAYFRPAEVRAQARRHRLNSDSSHRFERGVDPEGTAEACDALAALIVEICGGEVAPGRVEWQSTEHPPAAREITLRPERASSLLGIPEDAADFRQKLQSLGLREVPGSGDGALRFVVPGYRPDLEREADLIEEIARLGDINAIPASLPRFALAPGGLPPEEVQDRKVRHLLRDLGLNETLSLRFASLAALDKLGLAPGDERRSVVPLRNPLSEEWGVLPTTYLPLLLASVARNRNHQEPDVRFFEIGRGFFADASKAGPRDPAVREERLLCLAAAGEWDDCAWDGRKEKVDFARLRGLLEGLGERLEADFEFRSGAQEPFLHPVESARCLLPDGTDCGSFGMLHPRAAQAFGLKGPVAVAEIRLDRIPVRRKSGNTFRPYSLHSGTTRDLNLLVPDSVRHADVLAALPKGLLGLESVRLNSVYRGQGVPDGHKALHYTFTYRSAERSLTDEEVNGLQEGLRRELEQHEGFRIK